MTTRISTQTNLRNMTTEQFAEYNEGMRRYIDKRPVTDCDSPTMAQGWWDALDAEAWADCQAVEEAQYTPSQYELK